MRTLLALARARRSARDEIEALVADYNLRNALHQYAGQFLLDAMIVFVAGLVTLAVIAP